ncbi:MAG: hypothetical protein FWC32_03495, partial [Firmicutes bacterium]|nr:hypothetical protein [Bacillota bacterium]
MSRRKLKARSRITQKMTKDGLIERNETTGDDNRISKRDAELDLRNAPVDGDISDMSAVPARGEKHSYSQVGNKSDVKTGTRNKHLYRQQYASKEAASSAVQPKVNTESHEQSLSQPIHGHDNTAAPQQELSTARPYEQPLSAQPTHEQETATVPQKEPTATALNERPPTRAAPTDVPSDTATQQSSGGKLKTSKDTSYRHSKQSMLQNTSATSALQNKPPTEPVLKHKSKAAAGGAGAAAITETPITTDNPRKPAKQPAPKLQDDGPIGTSEQAKSQEHPAHSDTVPSDSTTPSNEGDIDKSDGTVLSSDGNTTKSNNTAKPKDAPDPKLQTDKGSKLKFDGDEAVPELPKDRKLIKAAMRTNAKLDKAKADLPTQTKLRSRLTFDEQKGKTKREFFFEKEVKSQRDHIKGPLPLRPIKAGVNSAIAYGHKKVFQHEDENVGVKAGHKAELMAEGAVRKALRSRKTAPYTRVAKLQHKAMKKNINATYRRTLAQNPKLKSNIASRMWQKRKIRKQYAMALRNAKKMGVGVKNVAGMAKTGAAVMLKAKALFIKAKVALKLLIASPK